MYNIHYLNPISEKGTALWTEDYQKCENMEEAQAVMVRSAAMHELSLPKDLLAVARAGAGVNNIPLNKCAEQGIVVFNTPGANANGVVELSLCGMLLGCRDIIGGINWVQSIKNEGEHARYADPDAMQHRWKYRGHSQAHAYPVFWRSSPEGRRWLPSQ